jgi:hypothetical protein
MPATNSLRKKGWRTNPSCTKNSAAVPTMPYQTPNIDNMGILQGNDGLYSTIQMDRTTPDIMNALQKNPYALSVMGGL